MSATEIIWRGILMTFAQYSDVLEQLRLPPEGGDQRRAVAHPPQGSAGLLAELPGGVEQPVPKGVLL